MTETELYQLLNIMEIPVAYDHFIDSAETSVKAPFILYRNTDTMTFKADDKVFKKSNQYIVDLITEIKDFAIENQLEEIFDDYNIPYDKFEDYIGSEKIFQIRYFI